MIIHFYKCFGCGKRHDNGAAAIVCCAVVQEFWECSRCDQQFATAGKAGRHRNKCTAVRDDAKDLADALTDFARTNDLAYIAEPCGTGQSFAAGFGNFSTP